MDSDSESSSSRSSSSSASSSSSFASAPPIAIDEYHDDMPFDFGINNNGYQAGNNADTMGDDAGFNWDDEGAYASEGDGGSGPAALDKTILPEQEPSSADTNLRGQAANKNDGFDWDAEDANNHDGFDSAASSIMASPRNASTASSHEQPSAADTLCADTYTHEPTAETTSGTTAQSQQICNDATQYLLSHTQNSMPASYTMQSTTTPHRGSLRRILNPSSFRGGQNAGHAQSLSALSSSWPMYAINVAMEHLPQQYSSDGNQLQFYQVIFDRQQYEFCTRLFALLDTESQSAIGPDCIREFVCLHCPVVRRRDEAIFALQGRETEAFGERRDSPTFDEIWDRTIQSDHCYSPPNNFDQTEHEHRIGVEGCMVFCRLLALAHHQESQRRFASRHLQQMMRHKHGGGPGRVNPNEVVVVIDNPPPGPPAVICIRALADVEQERVTISSNACIQDWPFCPLPLPDLDLDHRLASMSSNRRTLVRTQQPVSIEPFSSSQEGDFILRCDNNGARVVVRRSYSDFEWLNETLNLHKRPGQGHLCGRILPPFPSKQGSFHKKRSILSRNGSSGENDQEQISERAIAVAKSGMGMISSMAKSVAGYVSGSTPSSSPKSKGEIVPSKNQVRSRIEEDIPKVVAHRIERYLNYLMENGALSNSFPLHAILQASQSGLESAKQTLREHARQKKRQKTSLPVSASRGGPHSATSIFSMLISKTSSSLSRVQEDDDSPWMRAAAQTAMALQFHGILEMTGNESTSAKIQHASLPKFGNQPACSWDDEDAGNNREKQSSLSDSPKSESNFEAGVINVSSSLVNEEDLGGYDMLPSPGPSEEHRVLNAGSFAGGKVAASKLQPSRSRFVYETEEQPGGMIDQKDATLGSIRVENDIDKLRDIIRSINHTLGKLHHASALVQLAQGPRHSIQLSILRDIDSWGDSGGEMISQRALVNGVASLEKCCGDVEESNKRTTNDLLWQSSLATSAVTAVTEVRDAVRASHTASRAKSAAFAAAEKQKKAYEACDHTSSKEKIKYTQTEASNAQSHAIHATVVEYEANIAKKRSAVSLAQDVKSWNIHRKRELLKTCSELAKSQQEACRKAADAWESLRDGLIDSTSCSATDDTSMWTRTLPQHYETPHTVASYGDSQEILAPEFPSALGNSDSREVCHNQLQKSSGLDSWDSEKQDFLDCAGSGSRLSASSAAGEFAGNSPQHDGDAQKSESSAVEESGSLAWEGSQQSQPNSQIYSSSDNVYSLLPPNVSQIDDDYFSYNQGLSVRQSSEGSENGDEGDDASNADDSFHSGQDANAEPMSTSMQSLIDGLMAWGEEGEQRNEGEDTPDDMNETLFE